MYSVLIYGFPIILVLFETALRYAFSLDTYGFLGPTLAAAAITSLVGNVKPKTQEIPNPGGKPYLSISKRDNQFVAFSLFVLFIMLIAWLASCYLSSVSSVPVNEIFGLQAHFFIGLASYTISMVLVAIKGML